jgi:predicted protein tyrosine phosphatase
MRDFSWCRRELAEFCLREGEHVHICITDHTGKAIAPQCGKKHINLFFRDNDPNHVRKTLKFAEDPSLGEQLISECFTEGHAQQIIDFVKSTSEDETIIVNCAAGISRSPGVVLAYRLFNSLDTKYIFEQADPNLHVATTLYRVLHESRS